MTIVYVKKNSLAGDVKFLFFDFREFLKTQREFHLALDFSCIVLVVIIVFYIVLKWPVFNRKLLLLPLFWYLQFQKTRKTQRVYLS